MFLCIFAGRLAGQNSPRSDVNMDNSGSKGERTLVHSPNTTLGAASSGGVGEKEGGVAEEGTAGKKNQIPRMIVTRARSRRGQEHMQAGEQSVM